MSVTFRFLHEDDNLPTFIHDDLQTLLVLALLFSHAAHGIIITNTLRSNMPVSDRSF